MKKILEFLGKAWGWIKRNVKLTISVIASVILFIFAASWYSKNKKIRNLQHELEISRARLEIEKLATRYATTVEELNKLKEQDEALQKEIEKVEKSLENKLKPDMSAEEIVEAFKKIGIRL